MVATLFADFARIYPERFINVTNGVTHRRWLTQANPALSALIDEAIGRVGVVTSQLRCCAARADDPYVGSRLHGAKHDKKNALADRSAATSALRSTPTASLMCTSNASTNTSASC